MGKFVHLHVHSQYSLLESAIPYDKLCQRVRELGMDSVAVTDSGNMFGAYEFYDKAKQYDVKPVFGAEVYYLTGGSLESRDAKRKDHFLANLILLVQNKQGYQNLCELLSIAHLKGFYYKPRLDKEVLRRYSEGLFALTGTLHGEVHRRFLNDEPDLARGAAGELQDIFRQNLYFELQDHGFPHEKKIMPLVTSLGKELGIPFVATNDCKYLKQEDSQAQLVLTCIQSGRTLGEEEDRGEFLSDQRYLKSVQEMGVIFKDLPEALENSAKIAEQCHWDFSDKSYHFPQFTPPEDFTLESFLRQEVERGFAERWKELKKKFGDEAEARFPDYRDRLERELQMILQMGFPGYFLIVADFINYAKQRQIPVGPGRGSAAGSLVAYSLKITDIDPLPYHLLFERFLNPERISMPDMDIDFCMNRRDEVIAYVREKYGHVAQIITFGKMKAKAVVRDVGRVLDLPYSDVDRIAKLIPATLNITLQEAIAQEPRLQEAQKKDPQVAKLMEIARSLEGVARHASMHAAGVVIADRPLTNFCPLYKGPNQESITQFDMKAVESIGLVKFDFLGLKTLTVLEDALKMVEQRQGLRPRPEDFELEDPAVYVRLSQGDGLGIFQLESSGMRDLLARLKPSCFEDIVALVALYRPGPLGSGMVDDFINRKHGKTEIVYELEALKPVLESTYGVIVYQEQVMQIASVLASFTLGDADLLRRAMGKKKPEEMAKQREKFMEGAAKNRFSEKKAGKIFDLMAKFAEYGFNKSHSAAYALVSYYTAYLKTHYAVEYFASLLTHEMGNTDKILVYIQDAKDRDIRVLPPDVNQSLPHFSVVSENEIRFGLAAVKGVGDAAISSILEEREKDGPFQSLFEFCQRVDLRRVNKKVLESLVKCGAFDSLEPSRARLWAGLDAAVEWGTHRREDAKRGQTTMFDLMPAQIAEPSLPKVSDWPENEKLSFEKEALGFYITGHPLARYQEQIALLAAHDTQKILELEDKVEVSLCGVVATSKEILTKRGKRMAFLSLEDLVGTVEVVVFSDVFETMSDLLKQDVPIYVKGNLDQQGDSAKVLASEIMSLEEMRRRKTNSIHLRIEKALLSGAALEELKEILGRHPGRLPTYLHLTGEERQVTVLELPPDLNVELSEAFIGDVEKLLGKAAVILS